MTPRIYDITTDLFRDVTDADITQLVLCRAALGELVTFLRKTDDPAPADLAVLIGQGKIDCSVAGPARFDALSAERMAAKAGDG